jgi:hypothetical protein
VLARLLDDTVEELAGDLTREQTMPVLAEGARRPDRVIRVQPNEPAEEQVVMARPAFRIVSLGKNLARMLQGFPSIDGEVINLYRLLRGNLGGYETAMAMHRVGLKATRHTSSPPATSLEPAQIFLRGWRGEVFAVDTMHLRVLPRSGGGVSSEWGQVQAVRTPRAPKSGGTR